MYYSIMSIWMIYCGVIRMTEHLFEDKCPNCGSDDLEFDIINPEGEYMLQKIDCNNCGFPFTIWSETKWMYDVESCKR